MDSFNPAVKVITIIVSNESFTFVIYFYGHLIKMNKIKRDGKNSPF